MEYLRGVLCVLAWIFATTGGEFVTDDFLLVVDGRGGALYQMSLDGTEINQVQISQQTHPVAIDYDPINERLYWTDVGKSNVSPRIYSSMVNGSDQTTLSTLTPNSSPEGIAIDPLMELIFYTDNGPDTINVLTYDGLYEFTVIQSAHNPRDLQIDRVQRHIYWADWGTGTIERSNYDGSGRDVIYAKDNAWINCLALDLNTRMMYWTDAREDVVATANMDTGAWVDTVVDGSTAVRSGGPSPHYYGVTIDHDYIYMTDWNTPKVMRVNRDGTNYRSIGPADQFTMLNSIHAYQSSMYSPGGMNPCTVVKGGCSDLCLPLEGVEYVCVCVEGKTLGADNRTCVTEEHSSGPDLVWLEFDGTSSSYVRGVKGEPRSFIRAQSLESWRIHSPLWHWKAMDFNYEKQMLYMVDGFDKYITQLNLNGTLSLQVIHYGLSSSVNGLAYDWMSQSLYWTDSLYNWIRVSTTQLRTENVKTIVQSNLDSPHGIAVHPHKGLLFWTDWGEVDKIERSDLAGENRETIRTFTDGKVERPKGITVDYDNDRIYWCNSMQMISATLDGTDARVHYTSNLVNLGGITFHENYIIATDEGRSASRPYIIFLNVNSPNVVPKLGLDRTPTDVVMYHKDRQPTLGKTLRCGECSQLCVTEPLFENYTRCLCRDGYALDSSDMRTCTPSTLTQPGFIFSMGNKICAVPFEEMHSTQTDPDQFCFFDTPDTPSKYTFTALDLDSHNAVIYFAEVNYGTKTIRRARLDDKDDNSVIVYGVGEVYGLAYDHFAGNIYWADYTLGQIWLARADGSYQKTLVSERNQPRALVLNLKTKKLHWSEVGQEGDGRIMSCDLDGSSVRVLVEDELYKVTGMSLDLATDRLYWVDQKEKEVEYVFFDGSGRTKVEGLSDVPLNIYDLALYEGFVGVTDMDPSNHSGVHVLEKESGFKPGQGITFTGYSQAYDILTYLPGSQRAYVGNSATNCGYDNGFCEQLCIQVTADQSKCDCMDGMVLAADTKTCQPAVAHEDKFLLVADDYRHTVHLLDPNNLTTYSSIKLPPLERPISVTYDPVKQQVYWSDFHSGTIKRSFMDGSQVEVIKYIGEHSRIDGLAYEPTSELLYYTDTDNSEIGVLSGNGRYQKVLRMDAMELANVRAIVLDVQHGYMYYTTRGTGYAKIMRADLTTHNPVVLVNSSLSWPTGLVLDKPGARLYWIDSKTEKIEVSNTDGTNRQMVLQLNSTADPFGITLVGSRLYWTDWKHRGLFSVGTDGTDVQVVLHQAFPGLNDIHYIDTDNMPVSSSCTEQNGVLNGGCSDLCIPQPGAIPYCACPDTRNGTTVIAGDNENCNTSLPSPLSSWIRTDVTLSVMTGRASDASPSPHTSRQNCACKLRLSAPSSTPTPSLPPIGHQNHTGPTCPTTIANGNFEHGCTMMLGALCSYTCNPGYVPLGTVSKLSCQQSFEWSSNPSSLCVVGTCTSVTFTSAHTEIDLMDPDLLTPSCIGNTSVPGVLCKYRCADGYVNIGGNSVRMCMNDLTWEGQPLQCQLTAPTMCLDLGSQPAHTLPSTCHLISHLSPGDTCRYACVGGYIKTGGDSARTCLADMTWSGLPIVCTRRLTTTTTTTTTTEVPTHASQPPTIGTGPVQGRSTGSSTMVITVTVAVIIAVAIIVAFVVGLAIIMYRRSTKPFARYQGSTNFNGTCTTDMEPVVDHTDITPSYDVSSDKVYFDSSGMGGCNNNLYVEQKAGNGYVKANGSVAFSNPGYGSTNGPLDMEEDSSVNNLYTEIVDDPITTEALPEQIDIGLPGADGESSGRTAFSNPMYANMNPGIQLDLTDSGNYSES